MPVDETRYEGHTSGKWRWLNAKALMGDHGRRPIVLTAHCGELRERKEDGLLAEINPDGPNMRLIEDAPELKDELLSLRAQRDALEERLREAEGLLTYAHNWVENDDEAAKIGVFLGLIPASQDQENR